MCVVRWGGWVRRFKSKRALGRMLRKEGEGRKEKKECADSGDSFILVQQISPRFSII